MCADNLEIERARKSKFEIHFQEIFTGEEIDVLAGGELKARVVAKTQFQTGLAHIEKLQLRDGEKLTILIPSLNLKATVEANIEKPFVTVTMMDGRLRTENAETSPGYL